MCNPDWGLWNTSILHNCLACFAQVGICSIIHSFSRRWCPLREGRSRGRNVWMEAFLGVIEIHRTPQLRWECKAPSSIAIQHNAQLFWKRSWQWPQTLTLGEFDIFSGYEETEVVTSGSGGLLWPCRYRSLNFSCSSSPLSSNSMVCTQKSVKNIKYL